MNLLILLSMLLGQEPTFPDADPKPAIEAAKKKATAENRRVLVLWGTNDHEATQAALKLLKKDKEVSRVMLYEYDLVLAGFQRLKDQSPDSTCPCLVITDATGKELSKSAAPVDSKAMLELLNKHKAEPWNAKEVLAAAMKRAAEEKKRVLLTFGAPW